MSCSMEIILSQILTFDGVVLTNYVEKSLSSHIIVADSF